METLYNLDKTLSAELSLKGNIMPDHKNTEKFMAPPWKPQLNPLCRSYHPLLRLKDFGGKSVFAKRIFINFEIAISREISFQTLSSILDGDNEITRLFEIEDSLKSCPLC